MRAARAAVAMCSTMKLRVHAYRAAAAKAVAHRLELAQAAKAAKAAKQEQIHALKVRWHVGYDGLAVVPYHSEIPQSGSAVFGLGMIDLEKFDDATVEAKIESRKLGQDWHYSASVRAAP